MSFSYIINGSRDPKGLNNNNITRFEELHRRQRSNHAMKENVEDTYGGCFFRRESSQGSAAPRTPRIYLGGVAYRTLRWEAWPPTDLCASRGRVAAGPPSILIFFDDVFYFICLIWYFEGKGRSTSLWR